ncbi:hypothetical protein [Sporolactobacillus putidus]|uniref:Uncharacterized protein n=1 Tax=Sporolactobacillus putidus TaxID=492735 RepID=A0A917RXB6_9BACL|nr:hypothetical protein [Sporolactobacillus putidus]GGL40435.1 hypothetical protein GCM10007968_00460 [Sporolactobacillus putidus]
MNLSDSFRSDKQMSADEERMVDDYIFLPLVCMALDHDKKVLDAAPLKFKSSYQMVMDQAIRKVRADIRANKNEIFDHHIRMTRMSWLQYDAVMRGQLFHVQYSRPDANERVNRRIGKYL